MFELFFLFRYTTSVRKARVAKWQTHYLEVVAPQGMWVRVPPRAHLVITMELQVGVKALIQNSEGRYLVLSRNFNTYPEIDRSHRWDIPGGRIEIGTPLTDNLRREIKEETALDLDGEPRVICAQDILRGAAKHVVRLTFLTKVLEGAIVLDKKEHEGYEWFTKEELLAREDIDIYLRGAVQALE